MFPGPPRTEQTAVKAGIHNLNADKFAFAADILECLQVLPADLRHLPFFCPDTSSQPIFVLLSLPNTRLGLFHITPPNVWIAIGTAPPLPPRLTAIDALCGIGGFTAALVALGILVAVAFDHDSTVIQQYACNFPPSNKTVILQSDILNPATF